MSDESHIEILGLSFNSTFTYTPGMCGAIKNMLLG